MASQDKKEMDVAAELLKDVHGNNKRLVDSLLRRTEPELPAPMPDGSEKSVKTLLTNMKKQIDLDKAGNPGVFDALEPPKPGSAKDRELDGDLIMGITHKKKKENKTSTRSNQKNGGNKKAKKGGKASTSAAAVQAQSTTAAAPQVEGTRKSTRLAGTALAAPGRFTIDDSDGEQDFEVSSPAECPNSPNAEDDEMQDAVDIDNIPTPSDVIYPPARGTIVPSVVYPTSNIRDTPINGVLVLRPRQSSAIHPPTEEQQADAEQRIIDAALERHPPWDIAKKARKAQDVEYEDIHTLFARMRIAVQRTEDFEATVRQNVALHNGLTSGFVSELDDEHEDIDTVLTKAYFHRMEEAMAQFLEENPPKGSKEEKAMRAKKNREIRSRRKAEADAREKEALESELLEIGGRMTRTQKMLEKFLTNSTPAQQEPRLSEPLRSVVWSRYRNALPSPDPKTPPKETEGPTRILKTPFTKFIGRYMKLRLSSQSGSRANGQGRIEGSTGNIASAASHAEAGLAKPEREASITNMSDGETLVPKTHRAQLPYTSPQRPSISPLAPSLVEIEAMLPQRPTASPLAPTPASSRRRARRISDSSASDTASGTVTKRIKLQVRKPKSPTPLASQQEVVPHSQKTIIVLDDDDEESELSDDMSDLTIKTPAKPSGNNFSSYPGRLTTYTSHARPQRSTVVDSSATTQPATSSHDDDADYSSPPSGFTTPTPSNPGGHAEQTGSGMDASPASTIAGVTIIPADAGSSQGSDWFGYRKQFQDGEDSDGDSRIYNEDDPTEEEDEGNCSDDDEEDYDDEDAYARYDDEEALTPSPVQILSDRWTPSETGSVEVRYDNDNDIDEQTEEEATPRQPKRNKGKERMRDDVLIVEDDYGNEVHLTPGNFASFERERARMGAANTREIHNVWTFGEEMSVADLMNDGVEDEELLTGLYNQQCAGRRIGLETVDGPVWVILKPRKLHEVREMMTQLEFDRVAC